MNEIYKMAIELVMTLVFGAGVYLMNKYVKPWLKEHNLMIAAEIAVHAAETAFGRYNGEKKLLDALGQLEQKGFDITAAEVIAAVNAAWHKMNTAQIAAGEKTMDDNNDDMDTDPLDIK